MQLYAGPSEEFIDQATQRRIAEQLGHAFYDYYRFRASASEFNSWQNSLTALGNQLRYSGIRDHGVVLEMQLPLSSARLDAFVFGRSPEGNDTAVLLELKQWTAAEPSEWDDCVEAFVGGAMRKHLHPSLQARSYAEYLQNSHSSFNLEKGGITIAPCAWLHNMHPGAAGVLRSDQFRHLLSDSPLFISDDSDTLSQFFLRWIGAGVGVPIMNKALIGKHAPSRKLLENTAAMVKGEPRYNLIDDQIVAYKAVLGMVRRAQKNKTEKAIVAVHGGPGTGKSVIALNLLGTLSKMGVNVQHATGSKAFTENLWRILGSASKAQVRYFNNFGAAEAKSIDVILADEAHRIRDTSNNRFTPKALKSDRAQIDELVESSKVTVFFIDDYQTVRPGEVGSMKMIREAAVRHGAKYESIDLRTQFRCSGSDEYIDWVDQLLEIRKTGVTTLSRTEYNLNLVKNPIELEKLLTERVAEGQSARLTAGYCWPWSPATSEGELVADVRIGDFARPWNARPEARRLRKDIPPSMFWATDPNGFNQIGCVYTAQGFEFDYVGVIWGPDLVIRDGKWTGQPAESKDHVVKTRSGARFVDVIKNTYRVLLTRGIKGAYLCALDTETRAYIENRLQ